MITLVCCNFIWLWFHKTKSHWELPSKRVRDLFLPEIGEKCIGTVRWVKSLPYARIDDIRFLVIKPGGYISKHIDVPEHNWLDLEY